MEKIRVISGCGAEGGYSLELVDRDCGDYTEKTPRMVMRDKHGSIIPTPQAQGMEYALKVEEGDLWYPSTTFRFPKNWPEDPQQKIKAFCEIVNKGRAQIATNLLQARNKASLSLNEEDKALNSVQDQEAPQAGVDELKKVDELKNEKSDESDLKKDSDMKK